MLEKLLDKKGVAGFELVLIIISLFAFSYSIAITTPIVSALEAGEGCCAATDANVKCATTTQPGCAGDFAEGAICAETSFCEKGCCYDDVDGVYDTNVLQSDCDADWIKDPNCNLPGAEVGCCVLNDIRFLGTQGQCGVRTINFTQGNNVAD